MPTIKQKLAFKKVLKGTPISHAMESVNYALSTSKTTGKLTRSKGWQELIDKHISEAALTKVHAEGLKATKLQGEALVESPDYATRHKYLETGYKLRGRLKEEKQDAPTINIHIEASQLKRVAARILDGNSESEGALDRLLNSNE